MIFKRINLTQKWALTRTTVLILSGHGCNINEVVFFPPLSSTTEISRTDAIQTGHLLFSGRCPAPQHVIKSAYSQVSRQGLCVYIFVLVCSYACVRGLGM